MRLDPTWHSRAVGANDAVSQVKSRMKVFLHGAGRHAYTPDYRAVQPPGP